MTTRRDFLKTTGAFAALPLLGATSLLGETKPVAEVTPLFNTLGVRHRGFDYRGRSQVGCALSMTHWKGSCFEGSVYFTKPAFELVYDFEHLPRLMEDFSIDHCVFDPDYSLCYDIVKLDFDHYMNSRFGNQFPGRVTMCTFRDGGPLLEIYDFKPCWGAIANQEYWCGKTRSGLVRSHACLAVAKEICEKKLAQQYQAGLTVYKKELV